MPISLSHSIRPLASALLPAAVLLALTGPAAFGSSGPGGPAASDSAGGFFAAALAGPFRWPLDGTPTVVRRFDPPPQPWLPGHRGVDLAAPPLTVVRAAGAGTVVFAGPVAGRPVVSVAHPGGLRTTYEPLQPWVEAGALVAPGDPLGVLLPGHAGVEPSGSGARLHWGLRRGANYLDPLTLLGLGRVRLLPVSGAPSALGDSPARIGVS